MQLFFLGGVSFDWIIESLKAKDATWKCNVCTLENKIHLRNCDACQSPRPSSIVKKSDLLSNRIKKLNNRYILREFPNISTKGQLNGLKLIADTCKPTLNHIKPVSFIFSLFCVVFGFFGFFCCVCNSELLCFCSILLNWDCCF